MKILLLGGTGATGSRLLPQLLAKGHSVIVIVRSLDKIPSAFHSHPKLTLIQASILELTENELTEVVQDCDAAISCLGHNISFRGIWGKPRRLVTEATRRVCEVFLKKRTREHPDSS